MTSYFIKTIDYLGSFVGLKPVQSFVFSLKNIPLNKICRWINDRGVKNLTLVFESDKMLIEIKDSVIEIDSCVFDRWFARSDVEPHRIVISTQWMMQFADNTKLGLQIPVGFPESSKWFLC